jgi:hypothetical protein
MTHAYPDREATIALLTDWQTHHAAMDRLFKGFAMYVGLEVEGPMFETVYSYVHRLHRHAGGRGRRSW